MGHEFLLDDGIGNKYNVLFTNRRKAVESRKKKGGRQTCTQKLIQLLNSYKLLIRAGH